MRIGQSKTWQSRELVEPTVEDLLDDPMTQWIMMSDGVRQEKLAKVLDVARRRLTVRRRLPIMPARPESDPDLRTPSMRRPCSSSSRKRTGCDEADEWAVDSPS